MQGALHLDRADVTSSSVTDLDMDDDDDERLESGDSNKEAFSTTLRIEPASAHSTGVNVALSHNMVDTLLRAYANVYPSAPEPPPTPPQPDGKTGWSISSISKKFTSQSFKSATVRTEPKGTQAPAVAKNVGSAALHAKVRKGGSRFLQTQRDLRLGSVLRFSRISEGHRALQYVCSWHVCFRSFYKEFM